MTETRRWLLAVLAITVAALFLYGGIPYDEAPYSEWDLAAYRTMAGSSPRLSSEINAPYAYRVLGPYLAGVLPGSDERGFRILTVLLSLVAAGLLFRLNRGLPAAPAAAALAAVFFVLNKRLFGFTAWDYFQVNDLLSLVSILVGYGAILERRWRTYAAALALGCLAKETPLLLVPVAFASVWEDGALRRDWRRVASSSIPAVAVFAVARLAIEPAGGRGLLAAFVDAADKLAYGRTWFRLLVNAFAPVTLVPVVFWRETLEFFRSRRHALLLLVLVFGSALFGINNERLMAPALVVFYPLLARILERRVVKRRWLLAVILVCGVLSSLHHEFARCPLPDRSLTLWLSLGALAVATIAAAAARYINPEEGGAG